MRGTTRIFTGGVFAVGIGFGCGSKVGGGSADGGTPDPIDAANAVVDSRGDVVSQADAEPDASTTWCQTVTHQFCADFDGDPYTAGWSEQLAAGRGKIGKTTTTFTSAPGAFQSDISAPDAVVPEGRLRARFAPRPTQVNFELDLRLGQGPPPRQAVEIFSIMQISDQYSTGIRLLWGGSGADTTFLLYQRFQGGSFFDMSGDLPTGRWAHVALTFVPPGTSGAGPLGSVDLKIDGVTIASYRDVLDPDYYAATSTATVLSVGLRPLIDSAPPSGDDMTISGTYDNVTLDLVP